MWLWLFNMLDDKLSNSNTDSFARKSESSKYSNQNKKILICQFKFLFVKLCSIPFPLSPSNSFIWTISFLYSFSLGKYIQSFNFTQVDRDEKCWTN